MPHDELIPAEQRVYGWIQQVFSQGVRRPGYPADRWAEQFCLESVRLEPVELHYWEPHRCSLTIRGNGPGAVQILDIECFPLPHSAPTPSLEAQLVPFEAQAREWVKGNITLCDLPLMRTRHATVAGLATWCYDPDATFSDSVQILPFGLAMQEVMEPAMAAGAAAFVVALTDYPADSRDYYVPCDGVARPIPGVWISGSDGARLRQMLAAGPVQARLTVESVRQPVNHPQRGGRALRCR